jgi:hypothetical protein
MFIPNSPRPPKGIARSDWLVLLKECGSPIRRPRIVSHCRAFPFVGKGLALPLGALCRVADLQIGSWFSLSFVGTALHLP